MTKSCIALAFVCLIFALPVRAFDWETATSNGREYVSLHSFCLFYGFGYAIPSGNDRFVSRNAQGHSISLKLGTSDMYLDGVHYVLSFPIEGGDHDWLVSRMDTIKLFEPILRPTEISGRHTIRGVVIDAGHGGSDNGSGSRLGNEKTYTLDTAYRLDAILRSAGLKTVFTRRTDTFVDLYERAHIASLYPDYCFVSIHFNSAMEEARGLETYCLSPRGAASTSSAYLTRGDIQKLPGNDYDTQNILLASMVHSEIIKLNPGDASADRGVKRARFVVIKQNVLPAILVEGGFVSNHMEAARVNRPDYRQDLAEAIARGVIKFANAMGGEHHIQFPWDASPPAPLAEEPPPAPAGLARDSANGKVRALPVTPGPTTSTKTGTNPVTSNSASAKPGATATTATATTTPEKPLATSTHKSKKNKKAAAASTPSTNSVASSAPVPAGGTVPKTDADTKPAASSSAPALNLAEPTAPTPSPEADKAPPEPDEPPTVNANSTPPTAGTNAAPATHEP